MPLDLKMLDVYFVLAWMTLDKRCKALDSSRLKDVSSLIDLEGSHGRLIWGSLCKLPSSWPPARGTQGRFRTGCCVSAGSGESGAEFREAQKPFVLQWFWHFLPELGTYFWPYPARCRARCPAGCPAWCPAGCPAGCLAGCPAGCPDVRPDIHGYYPWILSMDNIHGYYPWILSMDIIHG